MNILLIVEHYFPYIGGAEELWKTLSESLVQQGHQVKVVTTLYSKDLAAEEVVNGVEIYRLKVGNRFGFTFLSVPSCIKWARWADLIHTSSYNAAIPARIAARLTGTKSIITFHEVWGKLWFQLPFLTYPERILFYLFEKSLLSLGFDRFVGVSDYTCNCLQRAGIEKSRTALIYNGLDYSEFRDYQSAKEEGELFTFCYFGRPGVSKGLELLLPAFIRLSEDHPEVRLKMIVSTNPAKVFNWIKRKLEKSGKVDRVDFFHNLSREELLKEISTSSAVVIPSHSEGFCYAAAESVALGVPVVSSGKGALKEVVGGNTVELGELSIDSLKHGLERALKGEWNAKERRRFPLSFTIQKYIELYREL